MSNQIKSFFSNIIGYAITLILAILLYIPYYQELIPLWFYIIGVVIIALYVAVYYKKVSEQFRTLFKYLAALLLCVELYFFYYQEMIPLWFYIAGVLTIICFTLVNDTLLSSKLKSILKYIGVLLLCIELYYFYYQELIPLILLVVGYITFAAFTVASFKKASKTLVAYLMNFGGILVIFYIIYLLISYEVLNRYWASLITFIAINIIMATSLNFSTGFLGQLVLGHAGFMAIGAYTAALIGMVLTDIGMPVLLTIIISVLSGGLLAALSGIIIGIPALRLRGDYLAIMTLAFGEIVRIVINNLRFTGGAQGLPGIPRLMNFTYVYFFMIACVAFLVLLARSRHGRAIISIKENEIASEAVGINSTRYKVTGLALSAMIGGIGGGLYAFQMGFLQPTLFGFMKSVDILVMVVLGGMGSMTGSILAAGVFTWLPEALRDFAEYRMIAYAVLLIVMMIVRPQGLFGAHEISFKKIREILKNRPEKEANDTKEGGEKIMALLDVKDLTIQFGGLVAVSDFDLSLEKNELVGLIGPNGAGKTTVFNMLTGVYLPTDGDITIDGKSIVGKKPYDIVEMGASRTFQNIRLFNDMTVLDNIKIAYNGSQSYSILSGILRFPKYWKEEEEANKKCMELLSVFDLDQYADWKANSLPYGQQRKLEIARALATDPKVLLLDEPAAGMNPNETIELMETIKFVKKEFDIAILLIEHDMHFVMNICERIIVIDYGKTIAKGLPDEIKKNPEVIKAYLGE